MQALCPCKLMRASPKVDTSRGPDFLNRQHICLQHYISCFFFIFCSNDSSIHSEGGLEVSASEYQNGADLAWSQKQTVRRKAEKALGRIKSGVGTGERTAKGSQVLCLSGSLKRSREHTLEFNLGITVSGGLMKHVISDSDRSWPKALKLKGRGHMVN